MTKDLWFRGRFHHFHEFSMDFFMFHSLALHVPVGLLPCIDAWPYVRKLRHTGGAACDASSRPWEGKGGSIKYSSPKGMFRSRGSPRLLLISTRCTFIHLSRHIYDRHAACWFCCCCDLWRRGRKEGYWSMKLSFSCFIYLFIYLFIFGRQVLEECRERFNFGGR